MKVFLVHRKVWKDWDDYEPQDDFDLESDLFLTQERAQDEADKRNADIRKSLGVEYDRKAFQFQQDMNNYRKALAAGVSGVHRPWAIPEKEQYIKNRLATGTTNGVDVSTEQYEVKELEVQE